MPKYASFAQFERMKSVPQLVAIVSSEAYDLEEAAARLGVTKKVTIDTLFLELSSPSLFAEEVRLHLPLHDKLSAKEEEIVEKCLQKTSTSALLITSKKALPKIISELIETRGALIEVAAPKPWEEALRAEEWIFKVAQGHNRVIQKDAIRLLARECSKNRTQLHEELKKLFLYTSQKSEITVDDVLAIVTLESKPLLWDLGDMIFEKNVEKALEIAVSGDFSIFQVLRYLRNQFHEAMKMGLGVSEKTGKSADKFQNAIRNYGAKGLQEAIISIDELEVELKNKVRDEALALEMLLIRIGTYALSPS